MAKSAKSNLNYKILGRRPAEVGDALQIECVDVEWTHDTEAIVDTEHHPITGPPFNGIVAACPECEHETFEQGGQHFAVVPVGTRKVIKDQINVPHGTADSIVMQICEEKKARLVENLGLTL